MLQWIIKHAFYQRLALSELAQVSGLSIRIQTQALHNYTIRVETKEFVLAIADH